MPHSDLTGNGRTATKHHCINVYCNVDQQSTYGFELYQDEGGNSVCAPLPDGVTEIHCEAKSSSTEGKGSRAGRPVKKDTSSSEVSSSSEADQPHSLSSAPERFQQKQKSASTCRAGRQVKEEVSSEVSSSSDRADQPHSLSSALERSQRKPKSPSACPDTDVKRFRAAHVEEGVSVRNGETAGQSPRRGEAQARDNPSSFGVGMEEFPDRRSALHRPSQGTPGIPGGGQVLDEGEKVRERLLAEAVTFPFTCGACKTLFFEKAHLKLHLQRHFFSS